MHFFLKCIILFGFIWIYLDFRLVGFKFDLNGDGCDGKICGACDLDCASYDDECGRLFEIKITF